MNGVIRKDRSFPVLRYYGDVKKGKCRLGDDQGEVEGRYNRGDIIVCLFI